MAGISLDISGYSERVIATVSSEEQQRRWDAVRAAMAENRLDVLVFHTSADALGGYVRWISDLATGGGYPTSVVFPADAPMTAIMHGGIGGRRDISPTEDPVLRGVDRILTTASFSSASYTRTFDAELIAEALERHPRARIGVVGIAQMPYPLVSYLHERFGAERFVDASELIDPIKAIKSAEELDAIRRTAAFQDEAFAVLCDAAQPGLREYELIAAVADFCVRRGSDAGVLMSGAGTAGEPAGIGPRRLQNRRLRSGDHVTVLIERNGIEGYYTELGRTLSLGPAPEEMQLEWEFTVAAQDYCANLLVPGADGASVLSRYNDFLREHGRPQESRLHCHGQGYDIVERPLAQRSEGMLIAPDMNIAVHPSYAHGDFGYWLCDNYVTTPAGGVERIHATERKIFEL